MPARGEAAFRSGRGGRIETETTSSESWNYRARMLPEQKHSLHGRHAFLFCWLGSKPAPISFRSRCFRRNFRARNVRALTVLTVRPRNLAISALVEPSRAR